MGFLSRKRVLVTGGNGFLGKRICTELVQRDDVVHYAPGRLDADLCVYNDCDRLFEQYAPDVVIHAAAYCGGIGLNEVSSPDLFRENMAMGMNVIDCCRRYTVSRLVFVGTTCSYPENAPLPLREENLFDGLPHATNRAYGIAKRALMVHAHSAIGVRAMFAIPANLYGPRDDFDLETSHVIPAMIRKFHRAVVRGDEYVDLWGTGLVTREFLYVDDCARGVVALADRKLPLLSTTLHSLVNLGTGEQIRIDMLAATIANLAGFTGELRWDRTKPSGQPQRVLSTERARHHLDWKPGISLWDGLRRTVHWWDRVGSKAA